MASAKVFSALVAALLGGCVASSIDAPLQSVDPSTVSYMRVYCTPDHESHFERVAVQLSKTDFAPPAKPLYAGGNTRVSTTLFVGGEAGWGAQESKDGLNHPTPAPQLVVVLAGDWAVTTTDGETRHFKPGEVVRLDDTAPCKGHIAVVGDEPGQLMFVR
jgi:hypothetical protein